MRIDMPTTYNTNQWHPVGVTDPIPELLNRVQALVKAGVNDKVKTYADLAKHLKENPRTVYGWFGNGRRFRPDAAAAVKMRDFAVAETLRLSRTGTTDPKTRELHSRFRAEYAKAMKDFPGDGTAEQ